MFRFVLGLVFVGWGWMTSNVFMSYHHTNIRNNFGTESVTPSLNAKREEEEEKRNFSIRHLPRFFLHIGPHKSATTSIQCALYEYNSTGILWQEDFIYFLGKVDYNFCNIQHQQRQVQKDDRIQKIDTCMKDTNGCWKELTDGWDRLRQQTTTVTTTKSFDLIISKESLSDWISPYHSQDEFRDWFWTNLRSALMGWNVTILLTYRNYHEWLPSAFVQDAYHMRIQSKNQHWPDALPESFPEALPAILGGQRHAPYPYLDDIIPSLTGHNTSAANTSTSSPSFIFPKDWNIQILNLHDSKPYDDIVQKLICDVLRAQATCRIYQRQSPKRISPAEALIYDRINIQAYFWNWTSSAAVGKNGKPKRFARMKATKQFITETLHWKVEDIPMDCSTNNQTYTLPALYDKSVLLQRQYMPDSSTSMNNHMSIWREKPRIALMEEHQNGSRTNSITTAQSSESMKTSSSLLAVREHALVFCTANATQVLLNQSHLWKEFFLSWR